VGQILVRDRALKFAEILHGLGPNMQGTFRTQGTCPRRVRLCVAKGLRKKGKILCVYSRCAHVGANFVRRRYVREREFFYTAGKAKGQKCLYTVGV
jgi:hypothetical protein